MTTTTRTRTRRAATVATTVDLPALESAAIAAVKAIDGGYAAASKAILSFALGAKEAGATPAVFDAGLARIGDAVPGVAKVTVGAYLSNARRIFAASAEALAKASASVGTDSLKTLAGACPAVSKRGGAGTPKAPKAPSTPAPTAPSAPVVKTADADPIIMLVNATLALRKRFVGKRAALVIIGEIEDLIDEIKKMAA